MKRSKAVSLILMGSMAIGGTGCGNEKANQEMYTFTSLNECVTSAIFTEAECKDMAREAFAQSPRFNSKEDCEAQFGVGACEGGTGQKSANGTTIQHGSGGMWMPMMMGFMAGRFLGGGGMMRGSQGLYRDPAAQPGSGRSFRTAGGEQIRSDRAGRVSNPSPRMTQSMQHNAKPTMGRSGSGARGGFSGGSSFGGGS